MVSDTIQYFDLSFYSVGVFGGQKYWITDINSLHNYLLGNMNFIITKKSAFVLLLVSYAFYGQKNSDSAQYYNWFDSMIGKTHTGLFNGRQYVDTDVNKIFEDRHAFFLSDKVQLATITYNNQTYYEVPLKYNLENDHVLVALKSGTSSSIIQLIDEKIEHFSIRDFNFKRLDTMSTDGIEIRGFYQIIVNDEVFTLYKKNKRNRKERIEDLGKTKIYYEFVDDHTYVLFYKESYWDVTSKSNILDVFPEEKGIIKKYYTDQRQERKSNPDLFMKNLFEYIGDNLSTSNDI